MKTLAELLVELRLGIMHSGVMMKKFKEELIKDGKEGRNSVINGTQFSRWRKQNRKLKKDFSDLSDLIKEYGYTSEALNITVDNQHQ